MPGGSHVVMISHPDAVVALIGKAAETAAASWINQPPYPMEKLHHSVDAALAVFAHELRQPLSCILYGVRSIHESAEALPDCRDICEIVERQARFLARMIEEALEAGERGRDRASSAELAV